MVVQERFHYETACGAGTKMQGIYNIINTINGHRYVGQASNLNKRKNDHFSDLRLSKHRNSHLQRAYNKYGVNAFLFKVLEENIVDEILTSQEQYWFDRMKSEGIVLYNMGDAVENGFKGRHHSEKTLAILRRPKSEAAKLKYGKWQKGRKLSETHKEKIRFSCKGIHTKLTCSKGHLRTPENSYAKSTCKPCLLIGNRKRRELKNG